MEQNSEINLFKSDIRMSPAIAAIAGRLRTIGVMAISASVIAGVLVGSLSLGLHFRLSGLIKEKDDAVKTINSLANREALLLSVKDRADTALSIMKVQPHLGVVIDTVLRITPEKWLVGVSLNDKGEARVDLIIDSVDDAVNVLSIATLEARQGHIVNVILNSLKLDKDGKVSLSFGFVPIL